MHSYCLVNLNCPQCKQYINVPSSEEGNVVKCRKCGHEFLYDRNKLTTKKAFAKAEKLLDVSSIKELNAGGVEKAAAEQTGIAQIICLLFSLAVGCWCIWSFHDASTSEDYSSFLCMLLEPQQQMFALFFGCIAGVLMAFAGRRHRILFIVLGILMTAAVTTMPYIFPARINPAIFGDDAEAKQEAGLTSAPKTGTSDLEIKEKSALHYEPGDLKPLLTAVANREDAGVLGVWVVGVNADNRDMLKSYLKRMTMAEEDPMFYDRKGSGGGLFVITPTPMSFEEFEEVAKNLGSITLRDKANFFMEVRLDKGKLEDRPSSVALTRKTHQFFVLANYRELSSLDMQRVTEAALRLTEVKPTNELKEDIVKKLIQLLKEPWGRNVEYVSALTQALAHWADKDNAAANEEVFFVVNAMSEGNHNIPASALDYLLGGPKADKVVGILINEWQKDTVKWQNACIAAGPVAEVEVLRVLNNTDDFVIKRSAAVILGEIGTVMSLDTLRELKQNADTELRRNAVLAVDLIEKRMGPPPTATPAVTPAEAPAAPAAE